MKDEPGEGIVIANLVFGVMAVVMLTLMVLVVQKPVLDKRHKALQRSENALPAYWTI